MYLVTVVIGLCEAVEKGLQQLQAEYDIIATVKSRAKHLILVVLRASLEKKWFQKLGQPMLDFDPLDSHIYNLCRKIAEVYIEVRIHHMKERNRELIKNKVRLLLSSAFIFSHQ